MFGVGHVGRQAAIGQASAGGGGGAPPTVDDSFLGDAFPAASGWVLTRASNASSFDSTGALQVSSNDAPRFDYEPVTHAQKGLLLEEARTQLLRWPASLGDAVWVLTGITVAAPTRTTGQVGPGTDAVAARLVYPLVASAGNASIFTQTFTATAVVHTASVWLRGNVGGEQVYLYLTPDNVTYQRQQVTLTTAWQKFTFVSTALTAATWTFGIGCDRRDASQTGMAASTIFASLPQVEAGGFGTSLINSGASALARAADALTLASGSLFTTPAGTIVVEGLALQNPAAGTNVAWVYLDDGTANNLLEIIGPSASANLRFVATAGSVALMNAGDTSPGTRPIVFKAGVGGDATVTRGALNGVITLTGPGGTFGPMNRLRAGTGGVSSITGHIRRVTYWPRLLSAAELIAATT